ncbi:MAG: type II secretion system protein [Clostridiales bacterium]|nr:type II secretion system protein [Clostridiales bacterium]
MKKMSNSKRGFTLTEILIVTAIVVLVSAAAFTGVAITLSRARETQKNLKENNGDNFENAARSEVDAINENAADFAEIPSYKPKDSEATESSDESSEGSESSTNGGGNNGEPNTPTPRPTATNTPTPKPSQTSETSKKQSSGNVTWGATVSAGNNGTGNGQQGVISATTDGDVTTFFMTRNNGWDAENVTITEKSNGKYEINLGTRGMSDSFKNDKCPDMNWGDIQFELTSGQITYLKNKYGIVLKTT